MKISYNWLSEYLPVKVEPDRLSRILTSIGLEVESMEDFEEYKGGLKGLVIGEVLETEQHPNADKLRLTKVSTGNEVLQIVCGAPNVAAGQRVVVAPVGATIYPLNGEPLKMKTAKIRGVESQGMICAEDEIGIGDSHAGIMVLNDDAKPGTEAASYFNAYNDIIYEIGLTPNRADAMSHWGVARDVCAYLSHHDKKELRPVLPQSNIKPANNSLPVNVKIENNDGCKRYSGISISGIEVKPSPEWMQQKLKAIGLRPINNIVDITNYIQHETGQPLHAFDYDAITGSEVIVKNVSAGTPFVTLDDKERKLDGEDLMICNAVEPMCIAGVFGGNKSGVSEKTKNIFLESAFFDPGTIRKTSFRHGLRTDAATRFEKGIDISNTVTVLKRAAQLILENAGGEFASDIIDVYPKPETRKEVILKNQYLKKLSGKNYHPETVKNILQNLGFGIVKDSQDALVVEVPFHKRDVSIPADVVEEILRIDGLDNIDIPESITITPSIEENYKPEQLREKIAAGLCGMGFSEILTNSITNAAYFNEEQLANAVKPINSLSTELNLLRPSMLPTALETIAYNSNRKNSDLKFFEFGRTYAVDAEGYKEINHLCLYITGNIVEQGWKSKATAADHFYLKGVVNAVCKWAGLHPASSVAAADAFFENASAFLVSNSELVKAGKVAGAIASKFDLKQPVYFADFNWDVLIEQSLKTKTAFREVAKFPAVQRDLAMIVPKTLQYQSISELVGKLKLNKLQEVKLFDVFESEKLGAGKKSMAVNFTFLDEEKTLTDKEIDAWMQKIMQSLEKEIGAEIRK
jgi:phenylalanyl-tRNA synthetase beta chain